jgi:dipeptidyl aminopeptidase/acylaminoacyl peptidase
LSGDEKLNFDRFFSGSGSPQADAESKTNPIGWFHISPLYYLADITAAVSIHQGLQDSIVPPAWTDATCQRLHALAKTVFCVNYADMGHSFSGLTDKKFNALSIIFFDNYLKGTPP